MTPLAFIEGLGGPELMMILFVVLLLFGGKKMPELARGLGRSMREFKKASANVEDELKRAIEEPVKEIKAAAAAASGNAQSVSGQSSPARPETAPPADGV